MKKTQTKPKYWLGCGGGVWVEASRDTAAWIGNTCSQVYTKIAGAQGFRDGELIQLEDMRKITNICKGCKHRVLKVLKLDTTICVEGGYEEVLAEVLSENDVDNKT